MRRYHEEVPASNPCYQNYDAQVDPSVFWLLMFHRKESDSLIYDLVPVGLDLVFRDILKFFPVVIAQHISQKARTKGV